MKEREEESYLFVEKLDNARSVEREDELRCRALTQICSENRFATTLTRRTRGKG
jgi:hypothetical protein